MQEFSNSKLPENVFTAILSVTSPCHSSAGVRTRSRVHVLNVINSMKIAVLVPGTPSLWIYQVIQIAIHDDGSGKVPPRPAQECGKVSLVCQRKLWCGLYSTILQRNPCVLIRIFPPLCCDHVFLAGSWFPNKNETVLEDCCCISKYKINSALDCAVLIKLTERMCIQSILIRNHLAAEEGSI